MKILFLLIFLGIIAISCSKDSVDTGGASRQGIKARLIIPGYSEVNTRAFSDSKIKDLWVLQYKGGVLIKKTYLPESTSWPGFDLYADNMSADPENNVIYFFSNTGVNGTDPLGADPVFTLGATLADLKKYQFPVSEASFDNYLPMRGEYTGGISNTTSSIDIPMVRMAAKIVFKFNATRLNQFIASSIQLCQVPAVTALPANTYQPPLPLTTSEPVTPEGGATVENPSGFDAYPTGDVFADYVERAIAVDRTGEGTFTWYMPENVRGSFMNVNTNFYKNPYLEKINDSENALKYTYILLKGSCVDTNGKVLDVSYKIYLGGNSTGDMNLVANTIYNVTTTITGTNSTDTRITAADVNFAAMPPSNCYILNANNAGQIFYIPVSQADDGIRAVNNTTNVPVKIPLPSDPNTDWTTDILWQTWQATSLNEQLGVCRAIDADDKEYIRLVLPPGVQNGNNAVIAIKDDTGKVMWSWHLWITDYNPDTETNGKLHAYTSTAVQSGWVFMDRNLGATWIDGTPHPVTDAVQAAKAYGLLYQWGRKDPFPGANGVSIAAATAAATTIYGGDIGSDPLTEGKGTGTGINKVSIGSGVKNNLVNAVQNPMNFYYSVNAPNDWYTTAGASQNHSLWVQRSAGAKSVFDPCPVGYRVPSSGSTTGSNPWANFGIETTFSAAGKPSATFPWHHDGEDQGPGGESTSTSYVKSATAGRLYLTNGVNAWYPATGYRYHKTGDFESNGADIVGGFGCVWSALGNTGETSGRYLAFDPGAVRPYGGSHRSYGFGVRCVKN